MLWVFWPRPILGGRFGPEKKYLAPPLPNLPIRRRHPPAPQPLPASPPPHGIFTKKKTDPAPPFPALRTPPFPPPRAENMKNIETSTKYTLRGNPRPYAILESAERLTIRQLNRAPVRGTEVRGPAIETVSPLRGTEGPVTRAGPLFNCKTPF